MPIEILQGDIVPIAMSLEDIETLNEICDFLQKGRSEVMVEALREYIYTHSIHFALTNVRRANERIRKELSGSYEIPMPLPEEILDL